MNNHSAKPNFFFVETKGGSEEEGEEEEWYDEDLFYLIRRKADNRIVVGKRVPKKEGTARYVSSRQIFLLISTFMLHSLVVTAKGIAKFQRGISS